MSLLESNAPKLNVLFPVYCKMAWGTGNFSKFNIQLQEQFKLLHMLQTWWSSCRITWIARISPYTVSLTCHTLESSLKKSNPHTTLTSSLKNLHSHANINWVISVLISFFPSLSLSPGFYFLLEWSLQTLAVIANYMKKGWIHLDGW